MPKCSFNKIALQGLDTKKFEFLRVSDIWTLGALDTLASEP